MKKIAGWTIFFTAWLFMAYGIWELGFWRVMIPGTLLSLAGAVFLGAIWFIRYPNKKELSK